MNKTLKHLFVAIWILFATLALARLWLVRTDLFPEVPERFAIWLVQLYGANNAEEVRDLETLLAIGVAFPLVLALTYSVNLAWQRIRNRFARS